MNPTPTKPNRWRPITVFNLLVGLLFSFSALGQTESPKSTYQKIDVKLNWQQAKEDAIQRGGHLATITTIDEQVAVTSLGISASYWLGGTDSNIEGKWEWITGEPFTYSNWIIGEPNNSNSGEAENYLMIGSSFGWNDLPNTISLGYILEIPDRRKPILATAVAQTVNGFVVGVTIVNRGSGYIDNPIITITGGGGTGAKATATQFNGVVTSITITNPGSGYTSTPTITIASPPFPPKKATAASQVVNGFVVGTKITDGGFGYDSPPAVMIVGGGGNGATAFATVADGVVTAIIITNPGSGYTSEPIIRFGSPAFAPKLSIETSKVFVRMSVVLGRKYQLESSTDLNSWTPTGPAFIAQDEELVQEFDVNQVGRYFRINQVP